MGKLWIQDGVREGLPYYRVATRRERILVYLEQKILWVWERI